MRLSKPREFIPMTQDDPKQPELTLEINKFHRYPVVGRLFRFITWWLIFSGIYASSSVCPFCGQLGCPVGGAGAGVVGGFFAVILEKGKVFLNYVIKAFSLIRWKLQRSTDQNH
ncbi:MAG: hypothetical protein ACOZF2_14025 [Thermodesulfobacteriota bacterium]